MRTNFKSWHGCGLTALGILIAFGSQPGSITNRPFAGPAPQPTQADSFIGVKPGDGREICGLPLGWCPPGRFLMGSPLTEPERRPDEAQVQVTLSKGFWIGKYEVTQGQWKRVVGKLPGDLTEPGEMGDDFPVYNVNYYEAELFCRNLTQIARQSLGLA